ncbi:MAG: OB-fold domain-containing protein [Pseudomonadales bacterium]|jgi:uncharacterized OB-fold protein|nr:OB-fold domain-containing protein [Pseudomonadales bacterium]MDG1442658.1 OB-fold domain-containing protein [Pseudomonadales bacterium]
MADKSKLPVPQPTPETQHFWDATKAGELKLQKCEDCSHIYFPPRPFCPKCASKSVKVFSASGEATLYSYVINHRPHPAFDGPYSIAVVTLKEGPRMMTNIINCEQTPERLRLDMSLRVVFEDLSQDIALPYFEPMEASS